MRITTQPKYKYENAFEWLKAHLRTLDHQALLQEASHIASQFGDDTIQDLYQSEMEADGYFEPLAD